MPGIVQGAILQKYRALGGERSFLGLAVTNELTTPDRYGRYNHFQGGSIYWTQQTGACEVHGAIREKWASLRWEQGFLKYPTTDELTTPDRIGRFNHFQGGSIYWTPSTSAHEVRGLIRNKWASMGWEKSYLGYPISDEQTTPDGRGRVSHFQGGSIYWYPDRGAYDVRKGSTGGGTGGGGISGIPDLSGTWRPRFYGNNGTIRITKTASGYTAVGVDNIPKYITREGNTLWLKWSSGGRRYAVHCGVAYVKSNQISWAFPPPDRTSYDQWNRV